MRTKTDGDAQTMRLLLAGYGAFGAVHARAWSDLGFAKQLVIADPDPQSRERARAEVPGARIVDDWRAVLPGIDAVDIVTPSDTHLAIALAALSEGCDVLIEKPMAMNLVEARQIAARAAETGGIVQVGYVLRTHPAAQRMRELVRAGRIGTPVWIDAQMMCLKRPRRDAGVVLNDAVHVLDLVLWAVGRAPDSVAALFVDRLGRGVEDIASITLDWRDGPSARVDASCIVAGELPDPYVPGGFSRKHVAVTGSEGQVVADFMTNAVTWRACRQQRTPEGWWSPVGGEPESMAFDGVAPHQSIAAELQRFVHAVVSREQPDADVHSGVAMAAVCDAIFRAARERRSVNVAM